MAKSPTPCGVGLFVAERGRIRLHFCPKGRNRSSAPSSRRRQRSSALHLIVRILTSSQNKTANTIRCQLFCGGGGRIRTIEAKRSRFTVCPLWPLGNSPIFSYCLLEPCILTLNGAGRRTRTPDLLITNQLLYQLSYTGGSNRTRLLQPRRCRLSSTFFAFFLKEIYCLPSPIFHLHHTVMTV